MISVVLLGTGNVSTHLLAAFNAAQNVQVVQVYGRSKAALQRMAKDVPYTSNLNELMEAAVYVLAISDDQIADVANQIGNKNALLVHTSGTQPLSVLKKHSRRGIFYPLQTFSPGMQLNFNKIPMCLEVANHKDRPLLEDLARAISQKVYFMDSLKRKKIHLAAVFVNNFTNHLYHLGEDICNRNELPFDMLHPLIEETAKKIKSMRPIEAQTGPARRNDQQTIKQQESQLAEIPLELYTLFTASIKKTYE